MTHQLVSCMMYASGNNVKVTLDWFSRYGGVRCAAASESRRLRANQKKGWYPGLHCEASINSDFWRHDPRPWESIVPIVTNGIRRLQRGKT